MPLASGGQIAPLILHLCAPIFPGRGPKYLIPVELIREGQSLVKFEPPPVFHSE